MPDPDSMPKPIVEATIYYYVAIKLFNEDAIQGLIALKNNGILVEESTLKSRIKYLGGVFAGRDVESDWAKQEARRRLEDMVSTVELSRIANLDKDCVALLRNASLVVASVSILDFES